MNHMLFTVSHLETEKEEKRQYFKFLITISFLLFIIDTHLQNEQHLKHFIINFNF